MAPRSGGTPSETLPPGGRVHVIGAGPVGLLIAALLQSMDGMSVHLYEKRPEYTRTRMVTLAQYLVADSVASYRADGIDGESVEAIFDPAELEAGLAGRRAIPTDLMTLVNIGAEEYEAMPSRFDGQWLHDNFPSVAQSMDRFIDKIKEETHGEVLGDLDVVRIPLDLYRARNATSRLWRASGPVDHPFARTPVFLLGDSAIGSPYFQSISLGLESAMYLAGLIARRDRTVRDTLDRYELYMYKQWLRVYMRTKMIKHNKDLLESVDDRVALLDKLHIY